MLKKLKNLFRRQLLEKSWQLPQMEEFDFPSHLKLYLIGFSYDPPTTEISTWLSNILVSPKVSQANIVRVHDASKKD